MTTIAGNFGYTGELKTRLQTIKTWPYDTPCDVAEGASRWLELDTSASMLNEIAAKSVEILKVNSCQIVVIATGSSFRCHAMHWKSSAAISRQTNRRDYSKVQHFLQKVILSDSPVLISHRDTILSPLERYSLGVNPLENLLLIPMRIQTEPAGVFLLAFQSMDFPMERINQALVFADQACKALHREGVLVSDEVSIIELVMVLGEALRTWDQSTSQHCRNLTALAEKIAIKMRCTFHEIQAIRRAAFLHDIGKIGISDQILQKPGSLNDREWIIMRQHPRRGANILRTIAGLSDVARLVEAHHEHYNGSGYPCGLKGTEIPLGARILSVVDAYTAMTENRVYRPARSPEEAIQELQRCSGVDFDPMVVKVFLTITAKKITGEVETSG